MKMLEDFRNDSRFRGRAIAVATVAGVLVILALMRWLAHDTSGIDIVELELAGTRETAWTLFRIADSSAVQAGLWLDLPLIAVYTAGLFFGLRALADAVRPTGEAPDGGPHSPRLTLMDTVAPRFALAAGACDLLQDGGLAWMLQRPDLGLGLIAGVTTVLTLASWTLLVVAAGHMLWLLVLPKTPPEISEPQGSDSGASRSGGGAEEDVTEEAPVVVAAPPIEVAVLAQLQRMNVEA